MCTNGPAINDDYIRSGKPTLRKDYAAEPPGKTHGKDAEANKPTYVKLMGLEGAKAEAQRLLGAALSALDAFDESADHLREIARYIVERDH